MKNFTTVPKLLAVASVVGALGFAYAQTNTTPPTSDRDTTTGTTARPTDNRDSTMGNQSNTTSGQMNNSSNSRTGNNMGSSTSDTTSNNGSNAMNGERPARADRN